MGAADKKENTENLKVIHNDFNNPARKKNNNLFFFVFLTILFVLGFSPVKTMIINYLYYETTDNAYLTAPTSVISTMIGGKVTEVFFSDNSFVKKDQVLVRLDSRDITATIKRLQSEIISAQALFTEARKTLARGGFDNDIKLQQSELNSVKALFDVAQKNLSRNVELFKRKLVSEKELDEAQATFKNLQGKIYALSAKLEQAKLTSEKSKDKATTDYYDSLAKVWSLRSQLEQAKLTLEETEIRAPDDGIVSKRLVEPGMILKPSQSITTLIRSNSRWIVANFKETQHKSIRVGQQAEIEVDSIDNQVFYGYVESISPGSGSTFALIPADNATGNFIKIVQRVPIKIVFYPESIKGFEQALIPGVSAIVKIRVKAPVKAAHNEK